MNGSCHCQTANDPADRARARRRSSACRDAREPPHRSPCSPRPAVPTPSTARTTRANELADRAARRPLLRRRVRRVAPRAASAASWPATPSQRGTSSDERHRDVADRDELDEVPGRVEAEAEAGPTSDQTRSTGPAKPAASSAARVHDRPRRANCGSQSQAWSDGSRKRSANGFVATTRSATSPSTSSAAVWPAQLLLGVDLRGAESAGAARRARPRARTPARARRARAPATSVRRTPAAGSAAGRPAARRRAAPRRQRPAPTKSQKREPAPVAPHGRPSGIRRRRQRAKRSTAADEERQQRRDEDELDRPAADDRARRGRRRARPPGASSSPCVERADQRLRGPAELPDPRRLEQGPQVRLGVEPAGAGVSPLRRERHRGHAAADERRLLVEAEREARGRAAGASALGAAAARPGLLGDPRGGGPRRGRAPASAAVSPAIWSRGGPGPAIASRLIDRHDVVPRRFSREVRAPSAAERAAVGRHEDERVDGPRLLGVARGRRRERARELDQRRRAGGVVVRARARRRCCPGARSRRCSPIRPAAAPS